jgi:hypothetical protein
MTPCSTLIEIKINTQRERGKNNYGELAGGACREPFDKKASFRTTIKSMGLLTLICFHMIADGMAIITITTSITKSYV